MEKHGESPLSYLFAHLNLLSSLSFSSLLFSLLDFSSLTLPTSAFPSVHIVGSLTSKLPSISIKRIKKGLQYATSIETAWRVSHHFTTYTGRTGVSTPSCTARSEKVLQIEPLNYFPRAGATGFTLNSQVFRRLASFSQFTQFTMGKPWVFHIPSAAFQPRAPSSTARPWRVAPPSPRAQRCSSGPAASSTTWWLRQKKNKKNK